MKALALLSGGLDSALAVRVLMDQGIEVQALHFYTGFCITERKRRMGVLDEQDPRRYKSDALSTARSIGVPVEVLDISEEYIRMVTQPKHGYGANANPCIDCRVFMLRAAAEHLEEFGASFVITGEVLNQRPMSQRRPTLGTVETEAGLQGLLLRPLSAKLLPPTIPEERGWVDRERLLAFEGRSRKPQLELAARYGITGFAQPAGGCCFLADETYAERFHELLTHKPDRTLTQDEVMLLGAGRHFRLGDATKLIVGRDRLENNLLARYRAGRIYLTCTAVGAPSALLDGPADDGAVRLAAAVIARYSDAPHGENIPVVVEKDSVSSALYVTADKNMDLVPLRI
ncbi:MAG: hypothetical protein A3G34_14770 [Candidatus Lindowbacteria bacterium RIFCSPLOWO2_12_FULL_62_27]|nr:MAG: hypothetical protein A3G34_14770 [Candidatus Lindowbacteria bacterium RIFCSPLOWO2_12_FULL_62_27]